MPTITKKRVVCVMCGKVELKRETWFGQSGYNIPTCGRPACAATHQLITLAVKQAAEHEIGMRAI